MTQAIRLPGDSALPPRLGLAASIIVITVLGALLGALSGVSAPRHAATGTVLFTGNEAPGRGSLYAVGRYVLDRIDTFAAIAESDAVAEAAAAQLGEPAPALRDATTATAPTTTSVLEITVEAPTPEQAIARTRAVAEATVEMITRSENVVEPAGPRVTPQVVDVDEVARDVRMDDMRVGAVIGSVIGLLAGWTLAALRRPGPWISRLARPLDGAGQDAELRRIDQYVQIEVLGALLLGQSGRGVLIALAGAAGIFGYAYTGSPFPPLAVVLGLLAAGAKDLRFSVGAILFAGVSVLPARVEIIDLGVITPTVLEVAIGVGVLQVLLRRRTGGPPGVFTGPVLAVLGALLIGAFVGYVGGASTSDIIATVREIFTLLSFFVVREAFRGRPYQLFAVLLVVAAASSAIALSSVPLNLELLQSQARDYVITGSDEADVTRLSSPVLQLWSPLLVILAAGVIRLRPRWLWAVILIPCLALQALSFNRSTWATLLVLAVIVAVLRGGRRGLLQRLGALVVIGAVALGALQAGVFGASGEAIALRLTSVITGNALAEDSLSDRLQENEKAWATLSDRPLFGTGIGVPYGGETVTTSEVTGVQVVSDRPWIHNQYLRIWLWMGVIGLVAYGWIAVRLFTISWFDRLRRGRASTITVSGAAGILAVAGQAVFATSLDNASVIISVALVLALIELSGAPPDADTDPDPDARRPGPDRRAPELPNDSAGPTRGSMDRW